MDAWWLFEASPTLATALEVKPAGQLVGSVRKGVANVCSPSKIGVYPISASCPFSPQRDRSGDIVHHSARLHRCTDSSARMGRLAGFSPFIR